MSEVLRELVVALSLDSDNFARNMRTISQQIKEAESDFRLAAAGVDKFEKSVEGASSKLNMLKEKLELQERAVEQYSRALVAANTKLETSYERQDRLKTSLENARAEYERLSQEVGSATTTYQNYANTLGEGGSATIAAKQNLEALKAEHKAAGDEVTKIEGQIAAMNKTLQNNADAISKTQTNLNNAKAAVKETEAEIKKLTLELNTMNSAWTKASDELTAFSKKCETFSKPLEKTGKSLSKVITAPIVALGTSAIKSSIDFESAFTSVRKTVDASEEEFAYLAASIKEMSTQVAASTTEIAGVMETAGQLGIKNEHLVEFTRIMLDIGNSTNLAANEAATMLSRFANITQMDQSQFDRLGSTLVELGNNFAATESEMVALSLRLAAAGKQVGLTDPQILGFAAALSAVGIRAEMGGSAFSKALINMEVAVATGNSALKDFAQVAGMTADEFASLWKADPAGAFQAFIVGLSKIDEEGASAIATLAEMDISEVRLRDTLMRATNATELFSSAQEMANKAWGENTALTDEANKRYGTTESQLINLKNSAVLFGQQIGDDLNPVIRALIDKVNELLTSFLELGEGQRMAIIRFAALAAAVGPALLIIGKTVSTVGKVSGALGTAARAIGRFSGRVTTAGGGISGFTKTVLSSKLAVAALSAALIYGAYKLYDYISGAKAIREALEGMDKTAKSWKATAAETFYSKAGLPFFGMTEENFSRTINQSKDWLHGLLEVWSEGTKKTDEVVLEWTDSFQSLTASTNAELNRLNRIAQEAGLASVSSQLIADMAVIKSLDAEMASLLTKRQSQQFTDKDKIRIQELIDTREAIEVKYNLSPGDAGGFETLLRKVEAEVARARAKGKLDATPEIYESAMVAVAEGMAAINREIDERYDKEYALIQLIKSRSDRETALLELNLRYTQNQKDAAEEYGRTLAAIVMPVWNQEDIQLASGAVDTLYAKLREYSIAVSNSDTLGMAKILTEMNDLTSRLSEGNLVDYLGVLTQIQTLMDSGMSEAEMKALFPDIDVSGQMEQVAALTQFVREHKETLSGLNTMFSDAVPEELVKIATDLDMTGAQARWDEFAANPGMITTQAVVEGYQEAEEAKQLEPRITAFIERFTEVPEGANKSALTPVGLRAYVEKYAEVVTGADVSDLNPTNITAMVKAYEELASGTDTSTLKPSDIVAYIATYLEKEGVDMRYLTPSGITAFVLAYEEVAGGASTKSLTPGNIAAMVTRYLSAFNIDMSRLSQPQITALVTAYAEATGCDVSALGAEVTALIKAYEDKPGVQKPTYIESRIAIVGYDLAAYNKFVEDNPVTVTGIVRVGEQFENPEDVLKLPNVTVWEDGREIPVNLVPANKIDDKTLIAYGEDGTLHVLITPQIEGSTESVRQAAESAMSKYVTTVFLGNETHNDLGWLNDIIGADLITRMNGFNTELEAFERNKGSLLTLFGLMDSGTIAGIDKRMGQHFAGENLSNLQIYVSELVAAIQNGADVSQQDLDNLQNIVTFLGNLELTNTGENIRAGIAAGMTDAGWDTDAESVASSLEAALNLALGIESPSTRVKPVGENVAAGVGAGMTEYDLSADAAAFALGVSTAIESELPGDALASLGTGAASGLASALATYSMTATGSTVGKNVKSAVMAALNASSLQSIGVNAMAGLKAGITAGTAGVVSAMKSAAQAAVTAAKKQLQISSPSGVFRDEVGRMTMKGFGQGVLLESKLQARTVANAARYLTSAAKDGSLSTTANDNRRTYNQSSNVNLSGNTFYVRDEQDIRSLAMEIAVLTKRQQRGRGLKMA